MSAPRSMDVQPDASFADALEARLLQALTTNRIARADEPSEEDLVTIDIEPATGTSTPPSRRRVPWLGLAAAAAAALLVVGIVVTSNDAAAPSSSAQDVSFDVQWPALRSENGVNLEEPDCVTGFSERHELAVNGCLRSFKGVTEFVGDVTGEGLWSMAAGTGYAADPDDARVTAPAPFNATYLFSGEVAGCGTGEFMMASQLQFVGWEAGEFVGTWSIVPNSGRGQLATISGSGEVLPTTDLGPRTHIGTISC